MYHTCDLQCMRLLAICTLLSNSNAILYCLIITCQQVCSRHFIIGMPTTENPIPQVELGYKKPVTAGRRKLLRSTLPVTKKRRRVVVDSLNPDVNENCIDTATDNLELERNLAVGYDVRVRSSIEYKNCEMQASVCMVDASSQ